MKTVLVLFIGYFCGSGAVAQALQRQLIAPGILSTTKVEYGASLSADMSEVFFVRSDGDWGKARSNSFIYHSVKRNGHWSHARVASFSGTYKDADPSLSLDGNTLYFTSDRPWDGGEPSTDIWGVERSSDGSWGEPYPLPYPINSSGTEYSPRTTSNGDLYFASTRAGGEGQGDLYVAPRDGHRFQTPRNMGPVINTPLGEWNLGISPDGRTLIFEASQRDTNFSPYGDLYISFLEDDSWTIPQNLVELNTTGSDLCPQFLGQSSGLLAYSSSDSLASRNVDLYLVNFASIKEKYERLAKSVSE